MPTSANMPVRIRYIPAEKYIKIILVGIVTLAVLYWLFGHALARYAGEENHNSSIRFAHFGNFQDYEFWGEVISTFQQRHAGVSVSQEYVVGKSGHYSTKLRQQAMTDTLPDVFLIQLGPFPQFAQDMEVVDDLLDDSLGEGGRPSRLDATAVRAFQWNGSQRAMPISGGNLLIYLNLDCLERSAEYHQKTLSRPIGPWTIDEFYLLAKQLTCDFDDDGQVDQFGFWLPRWIYYLPFMWSFGAETMDEHGQWQMHGTASEQAMSFYQKLAVGDRVCPRMDEVPQLFQDTGFLTGRTAMCINGPWFQPFLDQTRLAGRYVVLDIPSGLGGRATRITWDGVAIAAGLSPARKRLAEQFVRHLLSIEVQSKIARVGRALPARVEALPMFSESSSHPSRGRFVEALSYSRLQPRWPGFSQADRTVNKQLVKLIDSENPITPKEMLETLKRSPAILKAFELRN